MEIILKEDIIGLGYKNDIVNVKSGYGRNYLIPRARVLSHLNQLRRVLAENLKQQAHKLEAIKAEAEEGLRLSRASFLLSLLRLVLLVATYGSVNAATVAEELAKKGIEVDRKIITMQRYQAGWRV